MKKFTLKSEFNINGIGAASGLVYTNNSLFIISDNSSFLYEYCIKKKQVIKIKLNENAQENIPKKEKLDLESICLNDQKLYIFGSGSTSKREKQFVYDIDNKKIVENDLSQVYKKLKDKISISDEELNIEGALMYNNQLYLFQRGNGLNSKNGLFIIDEKSENIQFITYLLPKIKQVETTFTDAVLIEDKIYFLATAEDTQSTYDDGEILGSIIGCIDIQTLAIDFTLLITETQKFEGLTLYKKSESEIQFLLCEDNDTDALESTIYKLSLEK